MLFRNQFLKYMNQAGNDGADAGGAGDQGGESSGAGDGSDNGAGQADNEGDNKQKPSDREAQLLKESMARKEKIGQLESRLKEFEGVDPKAFREMQERLAQIDQQERERSNQKLIEEGKFKEALENLSKEKESVIEQMRTQSAAELTALKAQNESLLAEISAFKKQTEDLTIGAAFSNSAFIRDELVQAMSPERSRRLYGEHFDLVEGKVVGYDKPRGEEGRAPLVDKDGQVVSFDEAFKRILSTQPDYQSLIRAAVKAGAGSGTRTDKASDQSAQVAPGLARIKAGLSGNAK